MDRIAARRLVVETAGGATLPPAPHPLPIELERWTALAQGAVAPIWHSAGSRSPLHEDALPP